MNYEDKDCKNGCNAKAKKARNKEYDKYQRDKASRNFYDSMEWKKIRRYIIGKYNGLCLYSLFVDHKIVEADVVHHIQELDKNRELALEPSNLIPLSNKAHNMIHANYTDDTKQMLYRFIERYQEEYGYTDPGAQN